MRRSVSAALFGASLAIGAPVPACANVITDWDDKALVLVTPMTAVGATGGAEAPDHYRRGAAPGSYVPPAIRLSRMWATMKQFERETAPLSRRDPPIALEGKEWAADYNELKEYGGQNSAKRTAEQTEIARFWLLGPPMAYHPFLRQLAIAKQMDVVDSARFKALSAIAINDAIIAVLD